MTFKKNVLAITMIAIGMSSAPVLAENISQITKEQADIVFKEAAQPATLEIIPADDLSAGDFPAETVVGAIKAIAGSNDLVAYAFQNNVSTQDANDKGSYQYVSIVGKNGNEIMLYAPADEASEELIDGLLWQISKNPGAPLNGKLKLSSAQTVKADTYTVYMQAGIYTK
ncbi:hypothetical protein AHYW_000218 [Providencia manganoxydans]|uniref:hypothetical protein n=1 Tax=Providencia TaxID=586 RepID=UPI00111CA204|nr:hypothetical protein [Providencia stuartii]